MRRFLESAGDRPVDAYGRGDITAFLKALRKLPTAYGKSRGDAEASLAQLAVRADASGSARLSEKTVKRHTSVLSQLLQFAVDEGHLSVGQRAELVENHRFHLEVGAREQRDAWTSEDLVGLFSSPLWTGCHPKFRSKPGPTIIRDAKFWLPLLALFHGARLEEFADLRRRDLVDDGGVWAVRLVESEDPEDGSRRRLKTAAAARVVPLHPEAVRLGSSPTCRRSLRIRRTPCSRTSSRRARMGSGVPELHGGSLNTAAPSNFTGPGSACMHFGIPPLPGCPTPSLTSSSGGIGTS